MAVWLQVWIFLVAWILRHLLKICLGELFSKFHEGSSAAIKQNHSEFLDLEQWLLVIRKSSIRLHVFCCYFLQSHILGFHHKIRVPAGRLACWVQNEEMEISGNVIYLTSPKMYRLLLFSYTFQLLFRFLRYLELGIMTYHWLNSLVWAQVGQDFPYISRLALGLHQPSCSVSTGSFSWGWSDFGVALTAYPFLAPRLKKERAVFLLPIWAVRPLIGWKSPP